MTVFRRYALGDTGQVNWLEIQPLLESDFVFLDSLTESHVRLGTESASKVAMVKLNGGLGTTMGCKGPKSAIPIHHGQTFLDIIADQIKDLQQKYGASFPLILMNSESTAKETEALLKGKISYNDLLQHEFPRIDTLTQAPVSFSDDPQQEWSPAGHGDFYYSLVLSGTLDRLMAQGIEYVFISNADNLGPTFDPAILGYIMETQRDFLMETTPKTKMDVKGGTLIRRQGCLELLERAQVPHEHLSEFEDMSMFPVFNTNNIWVRLASLKTLFEKEPLHLSLIVNTKIIEGRSIVQLETALGSAISLFEKSATIVVGRDRFLPVKKTSDLLVIKSDLVQKGALDTLCFGDRDTLLAQVPEVNLSTHFESIQNFNARVTQVPSLKHLRSLTLDGDITLGKNVVFKGDVVVKVVPGKTLLLENRVLENQSLLIE